MEQRLRDLQSSRKGTASPGGRTVWIVGSFSLTGAELPRHAAQVGEGCIAVGLTPRFVGALPGSFAEVYLGSDLEPAPPDASAVIYLRTVLRLPPERRHWRALFGRVQSLASTLRTAGKVAIVRDRLNRQPSSLVQALVFLALRLRYGRKIRGLTGCTAAEVVECLSGVRPPETPPAEAEERVFDRILVSRPEGQRISPNHVTRALTIAGINNALKEELAAVLTEAKSLNIQWVQQTLRAVQLTPTDQTPRAIRACLERVGETDQLRLAHHLRICGQAKRARRKLRVPPMPAASTPRLAELQSVLLGTAPAEVAASYHRPLDGNAAHLSFLEMLLVLALRLPMTSVAAFRTPWMKAPWSGALADVPGQLRPAPAHGRDSSPALTVYGLASGETGLHRNLWMSVDALQQAGVDVDIAGQQIARPRPTRPGGPRVSLKRPVALYHLNADRIPETIFDARQGQDCFHVGFLHWELDRIPEAHRLALDMLDEIWVPSVYLQRLYQPVFRGKVVLMRKGLPNLVPGGAEPASRTRFMVAFDADSSVARKNPLAAVSAFGEAFPGRDDVELLVKSTPFAPNHWGDPEGQMDLIRAAAERDSRITLIEERMPFADLLGLIASSTAFISPHRAEGFGYFPAFAMALGRPVIATDYSGTRDFCTDDTAFPVAYTLRRVPRGHAIHPTPGARWAEINQAALARAMQEVVDDPIAAAMKARRGQQRLALDYAMEALASRYLARLTELDLIDTPSDHTHSLDEMFMKCS